jgi:hypothetical protein
MQNKIIIHCFGAPQPPIFFLFHFRITKTPAVRASTAGKRRQTYRKAFLQIGKRCTVWPTAFPGRTIPIPAFRFVSGGETTGGIDSCNLALCLFVKVQLFC